MANASKLCGADRTFGIDTCALNFLIGGNIPTTALALDVLYQLNG